MSRVNWKPGNMLFPLPVVMVSCGVYSEITNIITIAWTGTLCTDPPMCYISVRPERHSYNMIKESGEFVINLTTKKLAYATDWCGVKSGRDFDKFKEMKLTPLKGVVVSAPIIAESPVSIECRVKDIIELGSHHMFTAVVVNISVDKNYIDNKTDALHLDRTEPLSYIHGKYYDTGKFIGKFGYSIKK